MYRLFFWINNGEDIIQLPHVPADFPFPQETIQNESYYGLSKDYTMIGNKKTLREYEWESWWDNKDSKTMRAWFNAETTPYNTSGIKNGWEFKEKMKLWLQKKVPLRMFLYNEASGSIIINLAVTVETFDITIAKTGRYDYKIKVKEYNFVNSGNENGDFDIILGKREETAQPLDEDQNLQSGAHEFGEDLGFGLIWNGFFSVIKNPGITPTGAQMQSAYSMGYIWTGTEWFNYFSEKQFYVNGNMYKWDIKTNSFVVSSSAEVEVSIGIIDKTEFGTVSYGYESKTELEV